MARKQAVKKQAVKKHAVKKQAVRKPAVKPAAKPKAAARPAPRASRAPEASASRRISARIAELGDWRGETLARVRELVQAADPRIIEEWKWNNPVWSRDGIVCTGESYQRTVKLTFAKGAFLKDPARLFNSSLDGNVRRAIDLRQGDTIDEAAFKALVRAAVTLNVSGK
jgi:hypothetical protein